MELVTPSLVEGLPTLYPNTLAKYLILKINGEPITVTVDAQIPGPFIRVEDNVIFNEAELNNQNDSDLIAYITDSFKNFDDININQISDPGCRETLIEKKKILLPHLINFRKGFLMEFNRRFFPDNLVLTMEEQNMVMENAVVSIGEIANILGDECQLILINPRNINDLMCNASAFDSIFLSAVVLITNLLKETDMHKAIQKYSNITCLTQKYFDLYIKIKPEIINLSNLMETTEAVDHFEKLIQRSSRIYKSGCSSVFDCIVPENDFLGLAPGRYAIKYFIYGSDAAWRCCSEIYLLKMLCHENVVEMKAFSYNEMGVSFIVFPFYEDGDLSTISKDPNRCLKCTIDILCQVCNCLVFAHLHKQSVADFKPENFLIDVRSICQVCNNLVSAHLHKQSVADFIPENFPLDGTIIRLCDMGALAEPNSSFFQQSNPYAEEYPEEIFVREKTTTVKSDVYKLGIFIVHMVTLVPIWQNLDPRYLDAPTPQLGSKVAEKLNKPLESWIRPSILETAVEGVLIDLVNVAIRCLDTQRGTRPSAHIVLNELRELHLRTL